MLTELPNIKIDNIYADTRKVVYKHPAPVPTVWSVMEPVFYESSKKYHCPSTDCRFTSNYKANVKKHLKQKKCRDSVQSIKMKSKTCETCSKVFVKKLVIIGFDNMG